MRALACRCLALLAVVVATLIPGTARAAGLLKPIDGGAPLAIQSHDVRVDITDGIAVTELVQVFRNDGNRPLEAVYSFPLPAAASLAGFSMWVNGREMDGEVVEKKEARRIYQGLIHPEMPAQQDAGRRPLEPSWKDPGLVEEVSYREFQATICPVPAHGTQRIRLTYYQYLTPEKDIVTYVYPMETRVAEDSRTHGRFSLDVTLRSSVPITDSVFPGGLQDEVTTEASGNRRIVARLRRTDGDLDRDFVMLYRLSRQQTGVDLVTYRKPGEDGYFMLLGTSPMIAPAAEPSPVDYTFVVDVSGSMRRERKLEVAGEALARFLESCGPADRFNLIAFNVAPQAMSREALPNDAASRGELRRFLSRFSGVGGTDLFPALELAYAQAAAGRRQAIVVVSDGGLNDLDEDHGRFLRLAGSHDATIFGLAIGNEANVPLLDALARSTGGFLAQISTQDDLRSRGVLLQERMQQPPLRNLAVEVHGNIELADLAPARVPDLYPGAQIAVLGRYHGAGPAIFRLVGERGSEPVVLETTADLRDDDTLAPEIRRMWAERRVYDLLQAKRAGRLPGTIEDDLVRLGVDYSIVTPVTSFLVLETEEMYRENGIARRSHALLEEESRAREERARAADARPVGPEDQTPRLHRDLAEGLAGAVDPILLLLIGLAVAGPWVVRRYLC